MENGSTESTAMQPQKQGFFIHGRNIAKTAIEDENSLQMDIHKINEELRTHLPQDNVQFEHVEAVRDALLEQFLEQSKPN